MRLLQSITPSLGYSRKHSTERTGTTSSAFKATTVVHRNSVPLAGAFIRDEFNRIVSIRI
jgi:hypothetical protein